MYVGGGSNGQAQVGYAKDPVLIQVFFDVDYISSGKLNGFKTDGDKIIGSFGAAIKNLTPANFMVSAQVEGISDEQDQKGTIESYGSPQDGKPLGKTRYESRVMVNFGKVAF